MSMHNGKPREHPDFYEAEEPVVSGIFIQQARDEVYDLLHWGERGDVGIHEICNQLSDVGTDFTTDLMFDLQAADDKFRMALNDGQIDQLQHEAEQYVQQRAKDLELEFWKE